jgi:hypothetical protein
MASFFGETLDCNHGLFGRFKREQAVTIGIAEPMREIGDWEDVETIDIGRALVLAGRFDSTSQVEQLGLIAYWQRQREFCRIYGSCSARCQCELVQASNGEVVCPYTMRTCGKRFLSSVVSMWRGINK